MRRCLLASCALLVSSCVSTQVPIMPDNYVLVSGRHDADYVAKVLFEFPAPSVDDFTDRAIRCGLSNLTVRGFVATDAASTWVGPATGTVYSSGTRRLVEGGDVVQRVSVEENRVTLKGREAYKSFDFGIVGAIADPTGESYKSQLGFSVDIVLTGDTYQMVFMDLMRAQQSTGYLENNGFSPIGVWEGSRADEIVPVIEAVASRLNNCIQS